MMEAHRFGPALKTPGPPLIGRRRSNPRFPMGRSKARDRRIRLVQAPDRIHRICDGEKHLDGKVIEGITGNSPHAFQPHDDDSA